MSIKCRHFGDMHSEEGVAVRSAALGPYAQALVAILVRFLIRR